MPHTADSHLAVCITGALRGLLEYPIYSTYQAHVQEPLAAAGWRVSQFIAIVARQNVATNASAARALRREIHDTYKPRSIDIISNDESESWFNTGPSADCSIGRNRTWANSRGDVSVLLQW